MPYPTAKPSAKTIAISSMLQPAQISLGWNKCRTITLRYVVKEFRSARINDIRRAAAAFGFFTFIQTLEGPERYGAFSFFETIPSKPSLQTA